MQTTFLYIVISVVSAGCLFKAWFELTDFASSRSRVKKTPYNLYCERKAVTRRLMDTSWYFNMEANMPWHTVPSFSITCIIPQEKKRLHGRKLVTLNFPASKWQQFLKINGQIAKNNHQQQVISSTAPVQNSGGVFAIYCTLDYKDASVFFLQAAQQRLQCHHSVVQILVNQGE